VDVDKRQTPFNKAEDDPFNSAWYCNILVAILGAFELMGLMTCIGAERGELISWEEADSLETTSSLFSIYIGTGISNQFDAGSHSLVWDRAYHVCMHIVLYCIVLYVGQRWSATLRYTTTRECSGCCL
jgi:hypothetical protein